MNERSMFEGALDRIQMLTRKVAKLERKLGRKAYWANHYHGRADKAEQAETALAGRVAGLEAELAALRQARGEARGVDAGPEAGDEVKGLVAENKRLCGELSKARLAIRDVEAGDNAFGSAHTKEMERQAEMFAGKVEELEQHLAQAEADITSLREKRERLVADNTALAMARNVLRGDREMLEDELRQVRHTLSMEQDLIRSLHRDVKLHKAYAKYVQSQSEVMHENACHVAKLPEDWHEVTDLPEAQGEAS